jgi:hypothetical protein
MATLDVANGATVQLNFSGNPAALGKLILNGDVQLPGLYGPIGSGATYERAELTGTGRLQVLLPIVASRKMHGSAGQFDIVLPLTGVTAIECRSGGATNDYQLVLRFAGKVSFQSAAVTSGIGSVLNTATDGALAVVNLTGVSHAQRVAVTLFGASDGAYMGDLVIPMRVLVGDSNGSGAVGATDISQVKSLSGQATSAANFRADFVPSDTINATDVGLAKGNSGAAVPAANNPPE